jgi:sugar phosphate isomerase/epimerase
MQIKYSCSYWGNDHFTPNEFIENVHQSGYDGVELFLQPPDKLTNDFIDAIATLRSKNPDFYLIAMQLSVPVSEPVDSYILKMEKTLASLAELNPFFINSHTGKDFYSFDDNCRVIEASLNFGEKRGIRILHETHRGRFAFHASSLLPYLEKFPELELVADFSHFCTVSESMLEDQEEIISKIIPHVGHIHARIGFEQGPQVNHPAAPEWQPHLHRFMEWWQQIVEYHQTKGTNLLTFTPEFGPVPYMPLEPFTQKPLSNVWDNNIFMLNKLKEKFTRSFP